MINRETFENSESKSYIVVASIIESKDLQGKEARGSKKTKIFGECHVSLPEETNTMRENTRAMSFPFILSFLSSSFGDVYEGV
jgi:hypothetical protein